MFHGWFRLSAGGGSAGRLICEPGSIQTRIPSVPRQSPQFHTRGQFVLTRPIHPLAHCAHRPV